MGIDNPTYFEVKGESDIIELNPRREWDLNNGVQTIRRFVGTADVVEQKFNEFAASDSPGIDTMEESSNGKDAQLVCRIFEDSGSSAGGNTEALNSVWELIATPLYKPIETFTGFNSISATRKRELEKLARDLDISIADPSTDPEKRLYGFYANQTLDFLLTEFRLRKTIILSSRSAITASYTSINKVVSLATIGPPTALLGTLTSLPKQDGSSGQWEWLKLAPQLRQVTKRKFQLGYEWWGAELWAKYPYGGTWEPEWT